MTELKLHMTEQKEGSEDILSKLDEIGIDYQVVTVPEDRGNRDELESVTGQRDTPALSNLDNNQSVQGTEEIIEYLNQNYESKSWRRKDKISDVIYHIVDGILEFL